MPVFFAAGIGVYFALPSEPPLWTAAAPFALLPLLWLFRRRPVVRGVVLLLLLATAGFADVQLKSFCLSRKAPPAEDGKLYLRGRIDRLDTNYRGRPRIVLGEMYDFEDNPVAGRYRLSMIHRDPGLEVGDCVEMVAAVSPPFPPSLADGYQFDRRLFFDGITGTGYIPSEVLPVKCPASSPRLADRAAALRRSIVERIYNILPPDEAAVAVAIVAGDQTKISRPLIDAYRNSGLAHFLSISGLHMSMLAGLMFFLVRMVMALIPPLSLRYNSKKVAAVLAIFIGAVYLVISGAAIPAQRAFIMTLVVLLAVLFERQAISVRTLTWAALIVLVVTPEALVGASFQMSFAAVFALVAFYEKYAGRLNRFLSGEEVSLPAKIGRGLFAYFAGTVIADLVASVATLPFGIYHFNQLVLQQSDQPAVRSADRIRNYALCAGVSFGHAFRSGMAAAQNRRLRPVAYQPADGLGGFAASCDRRRRFDAGLGVGADQSRRPLALPVARKLADMGNGGRCCRHACHGGGG